jgi:chitin synthase
LHDLSWGTKGLESGGGHGPAVGGAGNVKDIVAQQKKIEAARQKAAKEKEEVENSFRAFRSTLLLFWLVSNAVWLYAMVNFVSSSCYLKYLSYAVAVFNIIRFIGSFVFLVFRIFRRLGCNRPGKQNNYNRQVPSEWQAHYRNNRNIARQHDQAGQVNINIQSPALSTDPKGDYRAI